jgi:hypothetical protein
LKLIKAGVKAVHPNNPLLPRKSEDGIGDSYLLSINVNEGSKIAKEYKDFMSEGYGLEKELTDKQKNLLGTAKKISTKRKAAKDSSEQRPKKIAKEASRKKKTKK